MEVNGRLFILPRSTQKKASSGRLFLGIETSAVKNRETGWQRCNVLPSEKSTSSSSSRTEFIHVCVDYLKIESRWLYPLELECVEISFKETR